MDDLFTTILTLVLLTYEVTVPLFFIVLLAAIIAAIVAVVRRLREKQRPSRMTIIFLCVGGLFILAAFVMLLLSEFGLSVYLFGVGSSLLGPIVVGLASLCLAIGALLLMRGVIKKHLVIILAVVLSLWLLVFSSFLYFITLPSTYERMDYDTVIETEDILGHITITEYKIIFPGLMKEVELTYHW